MAVYKGKYILQGLKEITPEMERDLDLAYSVCERMHEESPCEMCGRCCHQPFITVRDEEIDRVSSAAGIDLYTFMTKYLRRSGDGRWLFAHTDPCAFLGKDNRCTIWKGRPEVCREFPYLVSMFMSRVYLAIITPGHDILDDLDYMDDSWPCTPMIKSRISGMVDSAREERARSLKERFSYPTGAP